MMGEEFLRRREKEKKLVFMSKHLEKYVKKLETSHDGAWGGRKECKDWKMVILNFVCLKECSDRKCKRKDVRLRMCGRCKAVFYCSRKHQKRDWKRHESQCFDA